MTRLTNWENQIGRRLRLRDLHVLFMVAERGSMAKAAAELGISQPAISDVIANLEHSLGVRLFDRSPQGVEPTIYGRALLKRSLAAFDELKQGIRDIEFLTDPKIGEVRFGCQESIAAAILPPIVQRFSQTYPRVVLRIEPLGITLDLPALHERTLDFAVLLLSQPLAEERFVQDLNVEILYQVQLVVAASQRSRWARRRKIDLAELATETWILPPSNSWNYAQVAEAFLARGLDMPKIRLETISSVVRASLLTAGPYIATFPSLFMRLYASRFSLKVLPIELPVRPWPVVIVTLKNRTLSPVVERFIEHVRDFTRTMRADEPTPQE
jgi:DNA-binding transcriptional LysR family regulator